MVRVNAYFVACAMLGFIVLCCACCAVLRKMDVAGGVVVKCSRYSRCTRTIPGYRSLKEVLAETPAEVINKEQVGVLG